MENSKRNDYQRKVREDKKAQGVCLFCSNRAVMGKTLCESHLEKNKVRNNNSRKKRLAAGLCQYCGCKALKSPDRVKTSLCQICYLKRLSQDQFGSSDRWEELVSLFESQNICPYTGKQLRLGIDTSLDHVVPRASGGSDELENLQFVYSCGSFDLNRMKGHMTDREFRKALRLIWENISD